LSPTLHLLRDCMLLKGPHRTSLNMLSKRKLGEQQAATYN